MNSLNMAKITRLVPPRAALLLGECHKLASERWPGVLKLVLDRVDDTFFELANKAESAQRQQNYFDAMRCLRLRRPQLERAFLDAVQRVYEVRTGALSRSVPPRPAGLADELSLVEQDDVEESLAVTNLVENIKSRCKSELYPLDQRLGHLFGEPGAEIPANPFGPEALGGAFRTLAQTLDAPIEVRITLLKLCDKHAGLAIQELYRTLNDLLVREGVLPKLAHGKGASHGRTRVIIESDAGSAEVGGPDVFSTLQQLMQAHGMSPGSSSGTAGGVPMGGSSAGGRSGGVPGVAVAGVGGSGVAGPGVGGGPVPMATAALVSTLTQLQHGEHIALGQQSIALDPGLVSSGTVNVLRELRDTAGQLEQTDRYTLDIVTLLFDYILDDPAIPDAIKTLIGRLQIPLLKVALLDKDLFSRRTHPARRLLDALAEAALGWSASNRQHDALLEKIQYIVFRVIEEFDRDLGLFTALLEEFNAFLADEQHAADRRAELSTRSLQTREKIVLAKMAVDEAVKSRLEASDTREFVAQFVRDYWRQLLIVTHVEQGTHSAQWREQLAVIDDLVWSVQPKTTPNDKRELTTRLPRLIKSLRQGMQELALEPSVCSKFMTMLASVHVVSVKQVEEATLAERKINQHRAAEAEAAAAAQSEAELVRQAVDRLLSRKSIDSETLDIDLRVFETQDAATADGDAVAPRADTADGADALEAVMALDLGDWLEFTLADESTVRARFTWISPSTGQYLFTDREGRKAFDLTMDRLAQQFQAGCVRRLATRTDPLFDRAIGVLLERLEQPAVA